MINFILEKTEWIADINSTVNLYIHEKTRAKVLHISNNDDNKLFNIAFHTPPENDMGVFHIIEHSVLSGSRKYKTHDPFIELYSSSLNTFMNAITTMDITMYPFSTRNMPDFYNLLDMYLDAVFFPLIYEKKEIFYKEGWHYEINNKDDDIKYTGVVYNEMKGLLSDRVAMLSYLAFKTHYENHPYSFNSGGDPTSIPNLTYEDFLCTHKKYYHPSNSLIFFYGDMEIEKVLSHLDSEYLSKFDKLLITQYPTSEKYIKESYVNIQEKKDQNKKNKSRKYYSISKNDKFSLSLISLGYEIEKKTTLLNSFVLDVLQEVLFISPYSPIRLSIIESGIAKEVYSMPIKKERSDFFILGLDVKNIDEFISTIDRSLKELVEKGIDKELLEASINLLEMEFKEANYSNSHGLFYLFKLLDFWHYGINPFKIFNFNLIIKELREQVKTRFFEDFIQKYFLENSFKSVSILEPKKNLIEENEKLLKKRLCLYKKSLSLEEINKFVRLNEELNIYTSAEDYKGDKRTIPSLKLDDINREIWNCEYHVEKNKCFTLLHVNMFCSNIVYFNFAFDISDIDNLSAISFLTDLLTQLDTKNYSYVDLNKEIALKTGGLSFFPEVIENKKTKKIDCRIVLNVKVSIENYQSLFSILNEIIFNTIFDNDKKIKEVLETIILRMESECVIRGDISTRSRLASYLLLTSKYANLLGGIDYLWFLQDLRQNYETKKEEIKSILTSLYKYLFHQDNLVVSITTSSNNLNIIKNSLNDFVLSLPNRYMREGLFTKKLIKLNEGITCSSDVMYVAKGYDITQIGYKYSGKLLVLCNILNSSYLHNQIRAKGGAYGANIVVLSNKSLIATSYRDPHLKNTLKIYDDMCRYIENLNLTKDELHSAIIGSIKDFYIPIFPESEAIRALRLFLSGRTNEDIMNVIDEACSTSKNSLIDYAPLLEEVMKRNLLCVLGNEKKIKENEKLFDNIIPLKHV